MIGGVIFVLVAVTIAVILLVLAVLFVGELDDEISTAAALCLVFGMTAGCVTITMSGINVYEVVHGLHVKNAKICQLEGNTYSHNECYSGKVKIAK